jgi:general secretion pathway protein D
MRTRTIISLFLAFSLLSLPITAFAKKGEKNFKRGIQLEAAQQWDKAAQEFTLAVAADPANSEYQMHFRRASFNASQTYMQQGRSLAEQADFVGAYNAFRQAYGYDPVNELAVSEMERMLRMQGVKEGRNTPTGVKTGEPQDGTFTPASAQAQDLIGPATQMRVISYQGDLKPFIRKLAEELNLNVIFDRQSFAQSRPLDINLRDVTTAQALDYIFLQEGLFFQKLSRRTILVADQSRRPQYQQLVLRTFFLSNMKPTDARTLVQQAIPPSVGRPQTIVVPDDATNSLTVRDTAENVRLIGDLLQSIDKDRAEVVMDVNIYEVSKNDLMQFGNQIGTPGSVFNLGGSPGFSLLTDNGIINGGGGRGVNLGSFVGSVPTALAAALVFPSSTLTAFQSRDNTKLIASTQVHAFNGEESTARIGQRVPVQTAQAYPFGVQTGNPQPGSTFPTGGFPVINYEPTGLTLKFTPQVFPNLDVQVKMNIESKDVLNAGSPTPTFTERSITGTARVQNNRTMMLASVSQDVESRGRAGLPVLGGLPILGRLFTSPTRNNRQVDIVISVTPRVLRAPTVTPRDEEMRPSGTLQSPTTGSLAEMVREADRDDQIAAARIIPRNVTVQLPDAPVEIAPKTPESVQAANTAAVSRTSATAPKQTVAVTSDKTTEPIEDLPSYVPAPKSLVSDRAAAQVATVNTSTAGTQNAVLSSLPKAEETSLNTKSGTNRVAQLNFLPGHEVLKVGEKRRYVVQLNSDLSLSLALLALRFDPKVVKVNAVSAGALMGSQSDGIGPTFAQSVDVNGVCLISISALNSKASIKGSGALFFVDVEAIAAGSAALAFDKETLHLVATDARDIMTQLTQGTATVKQ